MKKLPLTLLIALGILASLPATSVAGSPYTHYTPYASSAPHNYSSNYYAAVRQRNSFFQKLDVFHIFGGKSKASQ